MKHFASRLLRLLSELKRRHVFKVAAAYMVGAWITIEAAATIFPLIQLPAWSAPLVVALAAVGFPLAILLAWAYDITPAGVVRTDATRGMEKAEPAQETEVVASVPTPLTSSIPADPARVIPTPVSSLIGREADVRKVTALLARHRVVTITGPGGMGKTRLALEVLARLDGGREQARWLVELAGLQDPDLATSALAGALGIVPLTNHAVIDMIADVLGHRHGLLVLDNCEHLATAVAGIVAALTPRCQGLRVLATSREPLRVSGEAVHGLAPLAVTTSGPDGREVDGDAVRLFEARAGAVVPGFRVTEANRDAVRAVCARVDGLPLALELSAARLRVLSPAQLEMRLERSFDLLSSGRRDLPDRHRTIGTTIDWSYDLLSTEEQRLFKDLSVFRGGFELDAVEAVAGDVDARLLDRLGDLIDRSLVAVDPGAEPRRYRMLETLRQYAWEHLAPTEAMTLELRHLGWCATLAESADAGLTASGAGLWLQRLDREMDNMRAAMASALARGRVGDALRVAGGLSWFWFRRGHVPEGRLWLDRVIEAAGAGNYPHLSRVLLGRASIQYLEGDLPGAGESLQRAVRMAESLGETRTRARALVTIAYIHAATGELEAGEITAAEGQMLARDGGHRDVETEAFTALGQIARARGDLARAETLLLEGVDGALEIGHHWQASSASWVAAKVALDRGDSGTAADRVGLCIRLMWAEGDQTSTLVGLHTMAAAIAMRGEPERAARLLGAVSAAGERIGYSPERMDPLDAARHVAGVRDRLTNDAFDRACQEGRALGLDAAVVLALAAPLVEPRETLSLHGGADCHRTSVSVANVRCISLARP
jgi:predicted ATPase